ncbi:ArsA family ATPase [Naumannella sp. ID2617S]|uniref:ATPase n=1 Tax=Enemella dayhoffiae TaxID=2016507 RepID=A0A255H8U3_9ACTN|nr:ArsA-related P-loop ATPase [Enemella dayhoffiae]NNG19628.1 ArsA family ATPase [Naumannella sp. ID2617S]OYO24178.1 ATPase [Enemella dayhoffiae]
MPTPTEPRLLHIVSGKGGTGKTTIAAALACALAGSGRRVLLCEVEGRQGLSELFGVPELGPGEERRLVRTPAGGQVFGLAIDAESALQEYLETFYRLGVAGRALDRFGVFDFATSIAPGLRDVLLTGKVYEAVRRGAKKRKDAYDAVVLDAPPTGRIARFLNVHEAVSGLARVGPIRNQADSIIKVFRSPQTAVHLVTIAEDMPVTETLEAIEELSPTGIEVADLICNQVTETGLDDSELDLAIRGRLPLTVPGLDADTTGRLANELATEAAWIREERQCQELLRTPRLPLALIPADPGGIDQAALFQIADELRAQLPEELG